MINHRCLSITLSMLSLSALLTGCSAPVSPVPSEDAPDPDVIQIGMSFDTFVLERWLRDRDVFVSTATELGAEVNVQNANGDTQAQVSQIGYLIDKQVDVLVIVAVDGEDKALHDELKRAREQGIRIIAYDRSITNGNVDLLATFDNEKVGALMAEAVLSQTPEDGAIVALLGSPSDNNVVQMENGIMKILEKQNRTLSYKNYADNWKAEYAYEQMNDCIDEFDSIQGVICGNDALAALAFKALSEHRMAGEVCLVGQDADIDACQRIVEGTQYMTVYKPIDHLARETAQIAVQMAGGEDPDTGETFFDGTYEVPFLKLDPVAVTKENIDEEIIASRFHMKKEVYLNVAD